MNGLLKLILVISGIFIHNLLPAQDTLSIEIEKEIQTEAYGEYKKIIDSVAILKGNLITAQMDVEKLRNQIDKENLDKDLVNDKIDQQIEDFRKIQHKSYNTLKHVLGRMSSASDVTNGLADSWIQGIKLSQTISNPFSNIVIRNKWDRFSNTAKWLPSLILTGYSFASNQSSNQKLGSMAIGVSITGIIDIIQNLNKKDGVNTVHNVVKEGGEAIEVISMYRAGYDDLSEIVIQLNNYIHYMEEEQSAFNSWYKRLEEGGVFLKGESELEESDFWIESTFVHAQIHLENIQKRMDYYYKIFDQIDMLVVSKMSNQIFTRHGKPGSSFDKVEFQDSTPLMVIELYNNLNTLRLSLNANKKSWEELRKRYYTLKPNELMAITSWIDAKRDISRLELLRK